MYKVFNRFEIGFEINEAGQRVLGLFWFQNSHRPEPWEAGAVFVWFALVVRGLEE